MYIKANACLIPINRYSARSKFHDRAPILSISEAEKINVPLIVRGNLLRAERKEP